MSNRTISRLDEKCSLCRINDANETGSHMVPNLLTAVTFTFDEKAKRDREIAELYHLNDPVMNSVYYGSQVSPEKIENDFGHLMTDEERENNTNTLCYDYIFCKTCEKRFGVVETAYGDYYKKIKKDINPRIAYLFWLSVFWRMSVGYMGVFMDARDELKIRDILNLNLKSAKEIIASKEKLGDFGYLLLKYDGKLIKGDSGILGTCAPKSPYVILVADYVVILFSNYSKLHKKVCVMDYEFYKEDINTFNKPVDDIPISREDFFHFRKTIVEESKHLFTPLQERVIREYREEERHKGVAESKNKIWNALKEAKKAEELLGEKQERVFIRQHEKFRIAYLKEIRSRQLGVEYDFLKDETLMLNETDVENYIADLRRVQELGENVSVFPFAKEYLHDDSLISFEEIFNQFSATRPKEETEQFWQLPELQPMGKI